MRSLLVPAEVILASSAGVSGKVSHQPEDDRGFHPSTGKFPSTVMAAVVVRV